MYSKLKHLKYILDETSTLLTTDEHGQIINMGFNSETIFGYPYQEVMGESFFKYVAEEDEDEAKATLINVLNSTDHSLLKTELRIRQKENRWTYFEVTFTNLVTEPDVQGILIKCRDITKQKEAQKEVERLTYYDDLTNLPNRRFFEKRLDLEISLAHHKENMFALLLLDLNQFKYVNQTLGDGYGDRLLVQVSRNLKNIIQSGTQIFRVSDDEFALITPPLFIKEDALAVTKKILGLFKQPFKLDDYELYITGSIGVSIYPESGQDMQTLLKSAEIALRKSKEKGSNYYQIYTSMLDDENLKRFRLANDLRKALMKKQLDVFYQPRVDCVSKAIIGVEASLAWDHPEWGHQSPQEFMPIARQIGIADELQAWFFEQVYKAAHAWHVGRIPSFKVSIQASSLSLLFPGTVAQLETILKQKLVDPSCFEIGLKESMLVEHEAETSALIRQLKHLGVALALDNFGKGFLSLSTIKKFDIDTVKLDPLFLKEVAEQEGIDMLFVMIKLAEGLKMKTIITGLDSQAQLKLIRKTNCVEVQGGLFSDPLSEAKFKSLLERGVCHPLKNNGELTHHEREYFRIELFYPLRAVMTVTQIKGQKINLGKTEVLIEDIGPGGLRFMANIRFPVRPELLLHFTTVLFDQTVEMKGNIVWSHELKDDLYIYGIKFNMREADERFLTGLLHQLQIQLKKNLFLPDCGFVTTGQQEFFEQLIDDQEE